MYKFYERSKGFPYNSEKSALNVVKTIQDNTPYVLIVRSDYTRRKVDDDEMSYPDSVYHVCDVDEEMSYDGDEISITSGAEFSDMEDLEEDKSFVHSWQPNFSVRDRNDTEGVTFINRSARVIDVDKIKRGVTSWDVHEVMPRFYHFRETVQRRKDKMRRKHEEERERERRENMRIIRGRDGFAIKCDNCHHKFFIWRDKHEKLMSLNKTKRFCHNCMNKLFAHRNKPGNKNYVNNPRFSRNFFK